MSDQTTQLNIFGQKVEPFRSALERYGVWPTTVWEVTRNDETTTLLKKLVGDDGGAREGSWKNKKGLYAPKASIFSPAVAAWALNCFFPTKGLCFDPFAGGGTRAIMAAKHGLHYLGVELREEEALAVRERAKGAGVANQVRILCADSCVYEGKSASADCVLTCPPYWNLEEYRGGPRDLSMLATYEEFLEALGKVIQNTARILKPGAVSCWIVGLLRDKHGALIPLHHDVATLHTQAGFVLQEEIVLWMRSTAAIRRVGNFDKGQRRLIRVHEYALVFVRS